MLNHLLQYSPSGKGIQSSFSLAAMVFLLSFGFSGSLGAQLTNAGFAATSVTTGQLLGVYKGELRQEPNRTFYFEIHLEGLGEDGAILGTSYIGCLGWQKSGMGKLGDYGKIRFSATVNDGTLYIDESEIIREDKDGEYYYWCIKQMDLAISVADDGYHLEGPFQAPGGCNPGWVSMTKDLNTEVGVYTWRDQLPADRGEGGIIRLDVVDPVWDDIEWDSEEDNEEGVIHLRLAPSGGEEEQGSPEPGNAPESGGDQGSQIELKQEELELWDY